MYECELHQCNVTFSTAILKTCILLTTTIYIIFHDVTLPALACHKKRSLISAS